MDRSVVEIRFLREVRVDHLACSERAVCAMRQERRKLEGVWGEQCTGEAAELVTAPRMSVEDFSKPLHGPPVPLWP
jgi:hypothetical protein